MKRSLLCAVTLVFAAHAAAFAQTNAELRGELVRIAGFEYEDLLSQNRQSLRFPDPCTIELEMVVTWQDGGSWKTTYRVPLDLLLADKIVTVRETFEDPPGVMLETYGDDISVVEERTRGPQTSSTYTLFIRTQTSGDAALFTAYLRRVIELCAAEDSGLNSGG